MMTKLGTDAPAFELVDVVTGLYAANAIQAALIARARTGAGQAIDLALFDVGIAMLANQALNHLATGDSPGRLGNAHPNIVPYQSFATRDGEITIAAGNDRQYRALCDALDLPELADNAAFATNSGRVAGRDRLVPLLAASIARRSSHELLAALRVAGVPAGPINSIAEAFADPQARHRGIVLSIPHETLGRVPGVASPVRLSDTPVAAGLAPPRLGQHSEDVLRDLLGRDPADIAALEARGVIRRG